MKRPVKYLLVVLTLIVLCFAWLAFLFQGKIEKARSDDPLVWEEDIRALEKSTGGPPGSVVFIGSSSIRMWDSLALDMRPYTAVKRGFGGSKMADAVHYAARLVGH